MVNVDYTQVMKHKTAYFSHDEIESMLNFCYNNNRIRDYVLIYVLLHTGRRITEILGERPGTLQGRWLSETVSKYGSVSPCGYWNEREKDNVLKHIQKPLHTILKGNQVSFN